MSKYGLINQSRWDNYVLPAVATVQNATDTQKKRIIKQLTKQK